MSARRSAAAAALAAVLTGVLFLGCAKKQGAGGLTLEPGVLSIAMEIGYPPFEYFDVDGVTPIGFDVQMGNALAAKLGLKAKFVDTAWDGIFAGVNTGKYDAVISAVTITEDRLAAYNLTRPYIGNAQAMVLLKGSSVKARTPEQLTGLGVAYQAETTSDIYMTKLAGQGLKFNPFEYDKVLNCFNDLELGRVDAIVCDSLVAVDFVSGADSPFEIVWQGPADETFGICLKKGNDALTEALDKALDELFADGTIRKISQNIFYMDLVSSIR
jgi:polar amino acid transport system substrate-binding protein